MKNRVKGLLALCLAMCMVLAMTTVAFGVEYRFEAISDSEGTLLNAGDTVKVENSNGCGMPFYVVNENGSYLANANTITYGANGQAYSTAALAAAAVSNTMDRPYFNSKNEGSGIVYDTFTLPAVKDLFGDEYAAGYHYKATRTTSATPIYLNVGSSSYGFTTALKLTVEENSNYKVEYDLNGGTAADSTNAIAPKTNVKWTDKVLAGVTDPTKEGFTFNGWKYVKEGSAAVSVSTDTTYGSLAVTELPSITLTAVWEVIPDETPTTPTPTHQHTRRQPAATTVETPTTTVASPKTFDAGVAVYGVMATLSLTGTAAIIGKKRRF